MFFFQEIMKANQLGSMLSMAKKSMANLKASGFLVCLNIRIIGGYLPFLSNI